MTWAQGMCRIRLLGIMNLLLYQQYKDGRPRQPASRAAIVVFLETMTFECVIQPVMLCVIISPSPSNAAGPGDSARCVMLSELVP